MNMDEIKSRASQLPPVDENVKIPAAIRAASARSDALHKNAYEEEGAGDDQNKQEDKQEGGKDGNGGTEGKSEKANAETGQEGKAAEKPAASSAPTNVTEWEHKYNSLKGRYDQQTSTISQLRSNIDRLQADLNAANAAARQAPARTPDNTIKGVTAEERETYGDDFLDVATRAASEKLSPEIIELRNQVQTLNAQLGAVAQTTSKTSQQQMYDHLNTNLPDWRTINRDPKFIEWASLQDMMSGAIRLDMMRKAFEANDANRVLHFFKAYLSDEAATAPASIQPTPKGKVPLEELAAPGRAKAPAASATPGEKEKPTITRAQISQFYLNVQKGVYKGNAAEKDRLEKMIFEAEQEGRVV